MPEKNNNFSAAIKYAEKGKPVFPCNLEKQPTTKNGFLAATTEKEKILRWWSENPAASIGMATGEKSKLWVLDIDLPEGPKNLDKLEQEYGSLPTTLTQETGGGGLQFFFQWPGNGTEIRNSASKIGKGIDVRGNGGYVILPPSPHPSGSKYKWITTDPPAPAPEWLINLAKKTPEKKHTPIQGVNNAYGQKALANELVALSCSGEGERNDQLNRSSYSLGQLIAGGQLDMATVQNALRGTASGIGLKSTEIEKTIASGIKSGMNDPRYPQGEYIFGDTDGQNRTESDRIGLNGKLGQESDRNRTKSDNDRIESDNYRTKSDNSGPTQMDLKSALKEWILLDKRTFNIRDAYSDLGIKNPKQKKTVSSYLSKFCEDGLIERAIGQRGVFLYKESDCPHIDFINMDSSSLMDSVISLPLGLEGLGVKIMPGNIIIVAGESNAGKTAITLGIAHDNLKPFGGAHEILNYFSSEMGPMELHTRVKAFGEPLEKWAGMRAIERTGNFHQVVDPDGLNIIDFMEVHDEFYQVGNWIRRIHETLKDGICVIALQKKRGTDFGRSGEISLEKPRLYLSISEVIKGFSSCKIVKAKNFVSERNPNGLEKDFRVTNRGAYLEELSDWRYVDAKERKRLNEGYELQAKQESIAYAERSIPEREAAYKFHVDGDVKILNFRDLKRWRESFKGLDVDDALKQISEDSFESSFLSTKNWYHQVSGMLKKKHQQYHSQFSEGN